MPMVRQTLSGENAALLKGAVDFLQQITMHLRDITQQADARTSNSEPKPHVPGLLRECLDCAVVNAKLARDMVDLVMSRASIAPDKLGELATTFSAIPAAGYGNSINLAVARARHLPLGDSIRLLTAESLASSYRLKLLIDRLADELEFFSSTGSPTNGFKAVIDHGDSDPF